MENLGVAYLNVGKLEEAMAILKDILAKKPSDLNILNMVAEAYYYSGKYQDAIDYWDKVLTYDKTNAQSLYMIGMSYQKKGEKEKGVALCDKAIEMDPDLAKYKQKNQCRECKIDICLQLKPPSFEVLEPASRISFALLLKLSLSSIVLYCSQFLLYYLTAVACRSALRRVLVRYSANNCITLYYFSCYNALLRQVHEI